MTTRTKSLRLSDELWSGLEAIAEARGTTTNKMLSDLAQEFWENNRDEPQPSEYQCAACYTDVRVGDPVIMWGGRLYCNLSHLLVDMNSRLLRQYEDMGMGWVYQYVPEDLGLKYITIGKVAMLSQGTWMIGQRVLGQPMAMTWVKSHPQVCKTCGEAFDRLEYNEVYLHSSYGSHHLGCSVPNQSAGEYLLKLALQEWLQFAVQASTLLQEDLPAEERKPFPINVGPVVFGRWTGTEVL